MTHATQERVKYPFSTGLIPQIINMTREGDGRVWMDPHSSEDKRYSAYLVRGEDTRYDAFPTREAAHAWLASLQQAAPKHRLRILVTIRTP